MWKRRRSVFVALRGGEDGFAVLLMVGSWLFVRRRYWWTLVMVVAVAEGTRRYWWTLVMVVAVAKGTRAKGGKSWKTRKKVVENRKSRTRYLVLAVRG